MEAKEGIRAVLQEIIVPELNELRRDIVEVKSRLAAVHKRLDDVTTHLADQSRRIDGLREELGQRIDETNQRIDSVREELGQRIDTTNDRIDKTNERLNRLYEVVVRREDHFNLEQRVLALERDVQDLKRKVA